MGCLIDDLLSFSRMSRTELAESPVWKQEIKGFLQGAGVFDEKSRLVALSPYERGRIPVVLVHGTASSAGRWA